MTRARSNQALSAPAAVEAQSDSAWPFEGPERGDFLHRVRVFPSEVRDWRERLVDRVQSEPSESRIAASRDEARARVDDGITRLREVARMVALLHPSAPPASSSSPAVVRVLRRLKPFREAFGLAEAELAPAELLALIPPLLAPEILRRLAVHAETTCRPKDPHCSSCELRKLCGTWRREQVQATTASEAPTAIDLFAGAGGISTGFERAGFRILAASDLDAAAMKTYAFNHPSVPDEAVFSGDVRELKVDQLRRHLGGRGLDVLIGAPPCQGFSMAGMRGKRTATGYRVDTDARNFLFQPLIELARQLKPRLFLMENVAGMETAKKGNVSFLERAARGLAEAGFRTATWKLSAPAHGVPQDRERCFLVASSEGHPPFAPTEEYVNERRRDLESDALPPVTFTEATFDLPERAANSGTAVDPWNASVSANDPTFRRFLDKFRIRSSSPFVFNHFVRYHNERDLELYALLQPGEDSVHAIERYGREDLMRYRRDVFDDKYARLRPNRPSKTIVAHLAKDGNGYIHPTQVRSISIREAARLQSFPDDFVFCGAPSDQWVQIGNAVPPVLATAIARSFLQTLKRAGK